MENLQDSLEYFYKLGKQPKENDKGGFKAQLEWLRDAEVALESLYTLAQKDKTCAALRCLIYARERSL